MRWATRGATGLLWTALACGPVGLMLGGVAFPTAQPAASAQTQQLLDTASERAAAEQFAEHFVVTWLTTPRGEEGSLATFIDVAGIAYGAVQDLAAHCCCPSIRVGQLFQGQANREPSRR